MNAPPSSPPPGRPRDAAAGTWSQRTQPLVRGLHHYATWLVGISWKRFFVLSVLLLILANILESIPPFSWTVREVIEEPHPPARPAKPRASEPVIRIEKGSREEPGKGVDIRIDERGIRVTPRPSSADTAPTPAAPASSAAPAVAASSPAESAEPAPQASPGAASAPSREIRVDVQRGKGDEEQASVRIVLPEGPEAREVREAVEEARRAILEALREPSVETVRKKDQDDPDESAVGERIRRVHIGDFLSDLALLWIVASMIIKFSYKGQLQARAEAAQATETAEAEQLKRQVAEARMAAMQAQVEPHFLFNTLASIDHLIETDPPRASRMQKSLIALLRATMPTLRDGGSSGPRSLGQEVDVINPYIDILKVRMEERLNASVEIPEGLRSAEFPPMMLQGLVENAIKHGLEPQPEGGELLVRAEIEHGLLKVMVTDTGVGLGAAPVDGVGAGSGLQNMRQRLALLYGAQATLEVQARAEGGTSAVITVPYRVLQNGRQDEMNGKGDTA